MITDIKKSYFAGLFDGEGCVRILKSNTKSGNISYSLVVQFCLTYEPVLKEARELYGGKIYKTDMEKKRNSKSVRNSINSGCTTGKLKQTYEYYITGWEACCFLRSIIEFCQEKKEQALVGVEFEEKRKSRSTSKHETERSEFYFKKLQSMKKYEITNIEEEFHDDQLGLSVFEEIIR